MFNLDIFPYEFYNYDIILSHNIDKSAKILQIISLLYIFFQK